MSIETSKSSEVVAAGVERSAGYGDSMQAGGVFRIECVDPTGAVKWVDIANNLVVNVGLQDMNTQYFKGSSYTAAWYLGLINDAGANITIASSDTLATHAGWTEAVGYSGSRKAVSFGTATTADPSVITNSSSPSSFTMTGNATIGGAFLANVASGTSGTLFSASKFQSPGDRSVVTGDVLNVTYTFNLDAA